MGELILLIFLLPTVLATTQDTSVGGSGSTGSFGSGSFGSGSFGSGSFLDIEGCIDGAAVNYNPEANHDDGTCIYPCMFEGYLQQGYSCEAAADQYALSDLDRAYQFQWCECPGEPCGPDGIIGDECSIPEYICANLIPDSACNELAASLGQDACGQMDIANYIPEYGNYSYITAETACAFTCGKCMQDGFCGSDNLCYKDDYCWHEPCEHHFDECMQSHQTTPCVGGMCMYEPVPLTDEKSCSEDVFGTIVPGTCNIDGDDNAFCDLCHNVVCGPAGECWDAATCNPTNGQCDSHNWAQGDRCVRTSDANLGECFVDYPEIDCFNTGQPHCEDLDHYGVLRHEDCTCQAPTLADFHLKYDDCLEECRKNQECNFFVTFLGHNSELPWELCRLLGECDSCTDQTSGYGPNKIFEMFADYEFLCNDVSETCSDLVEDGHCSDTFRHAGCDAPFSACGMDDLTVVADACQSCSLEDEEDHEDPFQNDFSSPFICEYQYTDNLCSGEHLFAREWLVEECGYAGQQFAGTDFFGQWYKLNEGKYECDAGCEDCGDKHAFETPENHIADCVPSPDQSGYYSLYHFNQCPEVDCESTIARNCVQYCGYCVHCDESEGECEGCDTSCHQCGRYLQCNAQPYEQTCLYKWEGSECEGAPFWHGEKEAEGCHQYGSDWFPMKRTSSFYSGEEQEFCGDSECNSCSGFEFNTWTEFDEPMCHYDYVEGYSYMHVPLACEETACNSVLASLCLDNHHFNCYGSQNYECAAQTSDKDDFDECFFGISNSQHGPQCSNSNNDAGTDCRKFYQCIDEQEHVCGYIWPAESDCDQGPAGSNEPFVWWGTFDTHGCHRYHPDFIGSALEGYYDWGNGYFNCAEGCDPDSCDWRSLLEFGDVVVRQTRLEGCNKLGHNVDDLDVCLRDHFNDAAHDQTQSRLQDCMDENHSDISIKFRNGRCTGMQYTQKDHIECLIATEAELDVKYAGMHRSSDDFQIVDFTPMRVPVYAVRFEFHEDAALEISAKRALEDEPLRWDENAYGLAVQCQNRPLSYHHEWSFALTSENAQQYRVMEYATDDDVLEWPAEDDWQMFDPYRFTEMMNSEAFLDSGDMNFGAENIWVGDYDHVFFKIEGQQERSEDGQCYADPAVTLECEECIDCIPCLHSDNEMCASCRRDCGQCENFYHCFDDCEDGFHKKTGNPWFGRTCDSPPVECVAFFTGSSDEKEEECAKLCRLNEGCTSYTTSRKSEFGYDCVMLNTMVGYVGDVENTGFSYCTKARDCPTPYIDCGDHCSLDPQCNRKKWCHQFDIPCHIAKYNMHDTYDASREGKCTFCERLDKRVFDPSGEICVGPDNTPIAPPNSETFVIEDDGTEAHMKCVEMGGEMMKYTCRFAHYQVALEDDDHCEKRKPIYHALEDYCCGQKDCTHATVEEWKDLIADMDLCQAQHQSIELTDERCACYWNAWMEKERDFHCHVGDKIADDIFTEFRQECTCFDNDELILQLTANTHDEHIQNCQEMLIAEDRGCDYSINGHAVADMCCTSCSNKVCAVKGDMNADKKRNILDVVRLVKKVMDYEDHSADEDSSEE